MDETCLQRLEGRESKVSRRTWKVLSWEMQGKHLSDAVKFTKVVSLRNSANEITLGPKVEREVVMCEGVGMR